MSDWLNKKCTIVISLPLMITLFTTVSAAELVGTLQNEASLNSTISRTLNEDPASESLLPEDEVQEHLSTIVQSGFSAVKSVACFVRKHPLKALTMFLAMQNTNSPFSAPGAEGLLTVTNINQTLTYIPDGPAVPFLPITVSSDNKNRFLVNLNLYDANAGNLSSSALALTYFGGGGWTANGNTSEVNLRLSAVSFKPAVGYRKTITIEPYIAESGGLPPYLYEKGIITLTPSSSTITTSAPSQPVTNQATSGQKPSSTASITQSQSTISSTVAPSVQGSQPITGPGTISGVTSMPIVGTVSTAGTLSHSGVSQSSTSPLVETFSDSSVTPSSGKTQGNLGTTKSELEKPSGFLMVPSNEIPYGIIGGTIGGIVLCGSVLVGVVAYLRKKYSAAQEQDPVLPIQQPLPGAHQSKAPAQYESLPACPANGGYEVMPGAPVRPANEYDVVTNVANAQPGVQPPSRYGIVPGASVNPNNEYEILSPSDARKVEQPYDAINQPLT